MDARNEMLRLIRARRAGFSLEQPFYVDPDFHRLDMELIWYRDWLFVGHDCEITRPGSYFTVQVGDYPVVVVRGRDGVIRALHNTCRHRGSRVCAEQKGMAARLVCPYHQWAYDLDGSLVFARQMGEDLCKQDLGLKPVACESVAGYVFLRGRSRRAFRPDRASDGAAAGVRIAAACESGLCGTCKVMKTAGEVEMSHNGGILDDEIAQGYILACCSRPLSALDIEA